MVCLVPGDCGAEDADRVGILLDMDAEGQAFVPTGRRHIAVGLHHRDLSRITVNSVCDQYHKISTLIWSIKNG